VTEQSLVERARRAIGLIDLTDLADDQSAAGIDELCRRAAEHHTAAVCVWPVHVKRCAALLSSSPVRVATVVNFPTGDEPLDDVAFDTRAAVDAGADEIDVVIPYRALLRGDVGSVSELVATAASALAGSGHITVDGGTRLLKVILETGALPTDDLVRTAATVAIDNGADFVKTSTGKIAIGATPGAARVLLDVIAEFGRAGRTVGIKPSGGVRSLDDVDTYIGLAEELMGQGWVTPSTFRLGASGLLDVLLDVIRAA
jgi:deoxyribose-phosphate aldolase